MRFGLVHRVMTDALAVLGVLSLVVSGELGRWVSVAIVAGMIAALAVPDEWQEKPVVKHLATVGPVVLLAVQIARLVMGATTIEVAVEFAAALQIVRLATRRGAAHDQQVIVLALLHLIAGTVLGGGIGYGLCFVGFLVVAPGALVLSHLRREVEGNYRQGARDRTGLPVDVPRILRSRRVVGRSFLAVTCLLSIPIFVFTAALFVMFPRVGLSFLLLNRSHAGRMVGFSDKVDLGNVGTLRSDPTIALRIEVPNLPDPPPSRIALHLRGTTFDTWNGRVWTRATGPQDTMPTDVGYTIVRRPPDPQRDRAMTIDLEPIDPPVLFLPPGALALRARQRAEPDPQQPHRVRVFTTGDGELRYAGTEERGVRYEVFVPGGAAEPSREFLSPFDRDRYLQVPSGLSPRIAELARTVAKDVSAPIERALALEAHLRASYGYDLSSPSGMAADPLDDFLFRSKRGHCEYYSTAMVVMLRSLGVPARNVTGFSGGTYNRFGHYYAVRQGDAHSWVEVFVDGRGWLTFDPTPPSDAEPRTSVSGLWPMLRDMAEALSQRWDRHVVGYDSYQQIQLVDRVARALPLPRSSSGALALSPMDPRRAWSLLALGAIVASGSGYWLWRLRRRDEAADANGGDGPARSREVAAAVALYETLESALAAQGFGRALGTPPLRHAETVAGAGHAFGPDVIALTLRYLHARFGNSPFSPSERRDFEQRVRRIRQAKRPASA